MTDFPHTKPAVKSEGLLKHCSLLWSQESEGWISPLSLPGPISHHLLNATIFPITSEHNEYMRAVM